MSEKIFLLSNPFFWCFNNPTNLTESNFINIIGMEGDMLVLVPRSHQELYEMVSLIGELLPPLPGDGVFAVDALLAPPGYHYDLFSISYLILALQIN